MRKSWGVKALGVSRLSSPWLSPVLVFNSISSLWRYCTIKLAIFFSIFVLGTTKVEIKTILRTSLAHGPSHTLKNTVFLGLCMCALCSLRCVYVCDVSVCMYIYICGVRRVHVRKRINVSAEDPCSGWQLLYMCSLFRLLCKVKQLKITYYLHFVFRLKHVTISQTNGERNMYLMQTAHGHVLRVRSRTQAQALSHPMDQRRDAT